MSRKPGRPPIENPKNQSIHIRVTPKDKEKIIDYCKRNNKTCLDLIKLGIESTGNREEFQPMNEIVISVVDNDTCSSCNVCYARNYDSRFSVALGERVDKLYNLSIGAQTVYLCENCLKLLKDKISLELIKDGMG